MKYDVKQKMILMCEVIIARGIQLGLAKEDQEWVKMLAGLRCTCLTNAGVILAENSECPIHAIPLEEEFLCKLCDQPIEKVVLETSGPGENVFYWQHIGFQPRHPGFLRE